MKITEAKKIAKDYLHAAAYYFEERMVKVAIDDSGTLSENGYTQEDCELIKKQLDIYIKRILK